MPPWTPPSVPARPEVRVAPHVQAALIRAAQAKLPEPPRPAQRVAPPPLHTPHRSANGPAPRLVTPLRVLQRAAAAAAVPAAAAAAVVTLTSAEVVTSFEVEVKGWPGAKFRYNTGHGGPTADGKTRTDVETRKADFDTAVTALGVKTYATPGRRVLQFYHSAI